MSRPSSRMRSCRRSSSIRISPTPRSTSVIDTARPHPLPLDDAGHRDHVVAAHDQRPALAVRARHLRVDEHVLHLPATPFESVAGSPPAYLKPWQVGFDTPRPPLDGPAQVDRRALEPQAVVLADRLHPTAEVDSLRAGRRVEQLGERGRHRAALVESLEYVALRARVNALEQRHQLAANHTAEGGVVGRVLAPLEPTLAAERFRLLAPDAQQRPDDAVLAAHLDSL